MPALILRVADVPDGCLVVRSLHGRERISQPFSFELDLRYEEPGGQPLAADAGLETLLGKPAVLAFAHEDEVFECWHGMFREIELQTQVHGTSWYYRAQLVPRLWHCTLRHRSRLFQDATVKDLVLRVLRDDAGMIENEHFLFHLTGAHPLPADTTAGTAYVVQHDESDLDFLSRWMEREGIFYFFDHGQVHGDKLVIVDSNNHFPTLAGHQYIQWDPADGSSEQSIRQLSRLHRILPERSVVRDYDYRAAAHALQSDAPIDAALGVGRQVRYGQHFRTSTHGAALAGHRAQEWADTTGIFRATSTVRGLRAGHRFVLDGHPLAAVNGLELIVVSVAHHLAQDDSPEPTGYHNELELLPSTTVLRPPRSTPWPRIDGIMHAVVDGAAAGTPAPLDSEGRYRVRFPYDSSAGGAGSASRWTRMAQPYAGPGYGFHFPLHAGTEVMVAHLDGDPDRPVILGAIPNSRSTSPVTSANATQNVVKTHNDVVIEIDDDAT